MAADAGLALVEHQMIVKPVQTEKFVAVSYLTDAKEYEHAATIIFESQRRQTFSPQYFLISQSIELLLKAFIVASGETVKTIRDGTNRHSLQNLYRIASGLGLKDEAKIAAVVDMLAPHHADHSFRYRQQGIKSLPAVPDALDAVSKLSDLVIPAVREAGRSKQEP